MKKQINELKRMQQLAGLINESQLNENFTPDEVMDILRRNDIDDNYFDMMGGKEIETGTEEWMNVLADITGKDPYEDNFDERDNAIIDNFLKALDDTGIQRF